MLDRTPLTAMSASQAICTDTAASSIILTQAPRHSRKGPQGNIDFPNFGDQCLTKRTVVVNDKMQRNYRYVLT
ncbi:MAG: hypothetical protein ACRECI_12220, partial [Methyloceanibacter sp.]